MFAELIYSTMEKIAVFPGSFDPFTVGHEEIVRRGLKLFDKIIIAVGVNPVKKEFLDTDCRIRLIRRYRSGDGRTLFRFDRRFLQAGECPHHYPGPEDGGRF